jgi:hypothetical protein
MYSAEINRSCTYGCSWAIEGRGVLFWIRLRDSTPWEGLCVIPTLIALQLMAGRARSDAAEFHQWGGLGEAP